jgi:hypothetical protein
MDSCPRQWMKKSPLAIGSMQLPLIGCHVMFFATTYLLQLSKVTMGFCSHMCHLSMKEGSLFCFVVMKSTMNQIMFLVSLESSQRGRVHGLGSMTLVVQKFLNIE